MPDPPEGRKLKVTTGSTVTFRKTMGEVPAREFRGLEAGLLEGLMVSLRPYRRCSRSERRVFYPNGSKCMRQDKATWEKTCREHPGFQPKRDHTVAEWIHSHFRRYQDATRRKGAKAAAA